MNQETFFAKADSDNAEFDFYTFCQEVEVSPKSILANMSDRTRNESFWKFAKKRAEITHNNWLQT